MADDPKTFWATLPGILTGLAAVLTALTGLFVVIRGAPSLEQALKPTVAQAPSKASESASNEAPASPSLAPTPTVGAPDAGPFKLEAVVSDPDGFANIRSGKSSSSQIVGKALSGARVLTHQQEGSWWLVKTDDGKIGFMHISRLNLLPTQHP